MLNRLRRLFVPVFVVMLVLGGLAYAAVDDENPATEVSDETTEPTPPADSDEQTGDDDITTPPDQDTPDDGEMTDNVDPETSHGRERLTEDCPEGFSGNHGQYVSGTDERPRDEAAQSPCGKPIHEDEVEDEGESDDEQAPESDDEASSEGDDDVEGS